MEDDPIAGAVGAAMKEEDRAMDVRLEKYARGQLSAAEVAALQREAAADPALAVALELHAPLSGEVKARIAALGQEASGAKVVPMKKRPIALFVTLGAMAAAAVFALLSIRSPAVLPTYTLEARAGDAVLRSENTTRGTTRADSEIDLVFRPAIPLTAEQVADMEVHLFAAASGSNEYAKPALRPLVSDEGAARWVGRADRLSSGKLGRVTFVVIAGWQGDVPGPEKAAEKRAGDGWQAAVIEVEITPLGASP